MPVPAQDGIIGEFDEWVGLCNPGSSAFDLSSWLLDDGEGGSKPYRMPEGTVLPPGVFILFYGQTTGIVLDDTGDVVRLLDPDGVVVETVGLGQLAPNASYSRDAFGNWHDDWPPSPGVANQPPLFIFEGEPRRRFRSILGSGLQVK